MASLACETGIAPSVLLAEGDVMLQTMFDYMVWRAKQMNKKR